MCEASTMPATSLFAPSMEHLADIMPAVQQEMLQAEGILMNMSENGSMEGVGDITSWLEDDSAQCYFELGVDSCASLQDVEVIASKVYLNGIVLVVLYFQEKFYVTIQDGTNEQPLLDTRFPDISCPSRGFQVNTYNSGVKNFPELRRISLWRSGAPEVDSDALNSTSTMTTATTTPMDEKMRLIDSAEQKQTAKKIDKPKASAKSSPKVSEHTRSSCHVSCPRIAFSKQQRIQSS